MSLPWVRIDTNLASHDKILSLLDATEAPPATRWRAAFSYVCSIGWSADKGTDGDIPATALPFIHGTKATARLLVAAHLWESGPDGWTIRNYADRQTTTAATEARRREGKRAACVRWHGVECWTSRGCSRDRGRA